MDDAQNRDIQVWMVVLCAVRDNRAVSQENDELEIELGVYDVGRVVFSESRCRSV